MRRYAGRHTYRDPFRAVYQKIRHPHGKDQWLFFRLVEIGAKINDILVQVTKTYFLGKFRQPCLRISHGRSPVSLDGAEIAMAVHKSLSFLKVLSHDHQSLIDRAVPVRMVFSHRIAYDTGTFPVGPVVTDPQFIHVVQSAALYRFESVSYVRQRPGDNDTHGVIDIGFLHKIRVLCPYDL